MRPPAGAMMAIFTGRPHQTFRVHLESPRSVRFRTDLAPYLHRHRLDFAPVSQRDSSCAVSRQVARRVIAGAPAYLSLGQRPDQEARRADIC